MTAGERPVLQLTRRGAIRCAETAQRAAARFDQHHCVLLPGFIEPALLAMVQDRIERGVFFEKAHGDAATELCLEPDALVGLLHFLVNDRVVYDLIEQISGAVPIRCFFGRVYRHVPGADHHQAWHSDVTAHRRVGLSVNVGWRAYEGGVFEIRRRDDPSSVASIANVVPGDAIVFRIAPALEHRVTPIGGSEPKTAFAGWFRCEPDYLAALRAGEGRPPGAA